MVRRNPTETSKNDNDMTMDNRLTGLEYTSEVQDRNSRQCWGVVRDEEFSCIDEFGLGTPRPASNQETLSEQLAPTSLLAVQNRMALDKLLAQKGGVCAMSGKYVVPSFVPTFLYSMCQSTITTAVQSRDEEKTMMPLLAWMCGIPKGCASCDQESQLHNDPGP
ncbi:uncharacterized protein AB9W97_017423 [Spinachia spinachia]